MYTQCLIRMGHLAHHFDQRYDRLNSNVTPIWSILEATMCSFSIMIYPNVYPFPLCALSIALLKQDETSNNVSRSCSKSMATIDTRYQQYAPIILQYRGLAPLL